MSNQVAVSSGLKNAGADASGKLEGSENLARSNIKKPLSILVVDDDRIIQRIHTRLMNMIGLEVETHVAENGKIAVDLCHSGKSFDLIFMDMEMPVKNGIEATKELREMGVHSMIVGVTLRSMGHEMETFMAAGLDMCFAKPLTVDKIKSVLEKLNSKN